MDDFEIELLNMSLEEMNLIANGVGLEGEKSETKNDII